MSAVDAGAAAPTQNPPMSDSYVRYALAMLLLVYTLNFVDRQIVAVLAEDIMRDLKLTNSEFGLLGGLAFAVFYTVLGIPIARVAERGDRVGIISVSLAIWSAFTAVCGVAQNFVHMMLARIGVGVGEAGCTPPAHSLISDYVPAERRASALAVYSMGVPIGTMAGFALGALVADQWDIMRATDVAQWPGVFAGLHALLLGVGLDIAAVPGWRIAFMAVGIPGVILAFVVWGTLREPRRASRGASITVSAVAPPSLGEAIKMLGATPSYWWAVLAATVVSFLGYGHAYYFGSFLARAHDMGLSERGVALAIMIGVAGVIGTWLGGVMADRAAKRDTRAYMSVPAAAFVLGVPFFVMGLLEPKGVFAIGGASISSAYIALALLAIPTLLNSMWYGPVYAAVQSLVQPRVRATAVAIMLLIVNLVGLGLGPTTVGILADVFASQNFAALGQDGAQFAATCKKGLAQITDPAIVTACKTADAEGLRWSLLATATTGILAVFFFLMARRTIREDLAKAQG